jgi:hypothetical protein
LASKANVDADSALHIEWDQPEKPVLLLPKLGTEWADADQATLDKLHAVGASGKFAPVKRPVIVDL